MFSVMATYSNLTHQRHGDMTKLHVPKIEENGESTNFSTKRDLAKMLKTIVGNSLFVQIFWGPLRLECSH